MNNYNFKLQRVLDYREDVENVKKSDFNNAKTILDKEQYRLSEILSEKELIFKLRNKEVKRTTINDLKSYNSFIKSIDSKLKKQEQRVALQSTEVDKAKNFLVIATKEKKILQKLREKDYKEYLYVEKKEEEKLVDQIVSYNSCMK